MISPSPHTQTKINRSPWSLGCTSGLQKFLRRKQSPVSREKQMPEWKRDREGSPRACSCSYFLQSQGVLQEQGKRVARDQQRPSPCSTVFAFLHSLINGPRVDQLLVSSIFQTGIPRYKDTPCPQATKVTWLRFQAQQAKRFPTVGNSSLQEDVVRQATQEKWHRSVGFGKHRCWGKGGNQVWRLELRREGSQEAREPGREAGARRPLTRHPTAHNCCVLRTM